MLTREQKQTQADELRRTLDTVNTVFVLENHGLSVNDVNQLRSKVRETGASYRVIKNSVVQLAITETPFEVLSERLSGPNAFAFTETDAVELAKVLRDFIDDHPRLVFKNVYLEGNLLPADEAQKLADLPSKDELLAKLVYVLQSPIRRLAVAAGTPLQRLATVLARIAEQGDDPAEASGDEAPTDDAETTTDETPTEAGDAEADTTTETDETDA